MHVLIAQNDSSREVLGELLREDGFEVSTARDEHQAATRMGMCLPDAVILDLQLVSLIRIRSFREFRRSGIETPVIVVSSLSHFAGDAIRAGASEFFSKPIDYGRLLGFLRSVVSDAALP
jgi:DNA-binding NtrC family response regulator